MTTSPCRAAWLLFIAAGSWTFRGASALSIPSDGLVFWERASTCDAGFSKCNSADLPSNFCCPSDTVCDVLAGNTTVLCCPEGSSCSAIDPITCDLSEQNADLHPDAVIKTTALNGNLPKCGTDKCCPFGYSCDSSGICVVNANQNAAPIQNVPVTTSTSTTGTTATKATTKATTKTTLTTSSSSSLTTILTTTSTASAVTVIEATTQTSVQSSPTSTTVSAGTTSTESSESAVASADNHSKGGTSTASVVGGIVGGLAGLLLIAAAVWFLCGRRMRGRQVSSSLGRRTPGTSSLKRGTEKLADGTFKIRRSTSSFGNIINHPLSISSPKPQGDSTAYRTDFIRKLPSAGGDGTSSSRPVTPASFGGSDVAMVGHGNAAALNNMSPLGAIASLGANASRDPPAWQSNTASPSPPPLALRHSRNPSGSVAPIRAMRSSLPRSPPWYPHDPCTEEINVGADPSIIGLGVGNFSTSPLGGEAPLRTATATAALSAATMDGSRNDSPYNSYDNHTNAGVDRNGNRLTTFSSLMMAAQLDPDRPYVPDSVQSSPASRQR